MARAVLVRSELLHPCAVPGIGLCACHAQGATTGHAVDELQRPCTVYNPSQSKHAKQASMPPGAQAPTSWLASSLRLSWRAQRSPTATPLCRRSSLTSA